MQPEQLFSNALDEISSWTNVPINKTKENTNTYDPSSLSVFEKLDSSDIDNHDNSNKQEQTSSHGDHSSEKHQPSIATIACNPILLNLSSNE
ncbi:unnamed protein product [Rotaria magnacalcarata]